MDLKLNADGDLDLGDNYTLKLVDKEEDLVRQRVLITLNTNRGEWDFDLAFGVPYIKNEYNNISILGKVPQGIFDSAIQDAILTRQGIVELANYSSTLDQRTRKITVKAQAITEHGEIVDISASPIL